jgi:hypothetical protein
MEIAPDDIACHKTHQWRVIKRRDIDGEEWGVAGTGNALIPERPAEQMVVAH